MNELARELGRRLVIGVGRIGARAVTQAYGSVLRDVASISREVEAVASRAQSRIEEAFGESLKETPKHDPRRR